MLNNSLSHTFVKTLDSSVTRLICQLTKTGGPDLDWLYAFWCIIIHAALEKYLLFVPGGPFLQLSAILMSLI